MVKLIYQCGIIELTNNKQNALDSEYFNLQTFLNDNVDLGLYSANKQQALRYYGKQTKKGWKKGNNRKKIEYPLSIRNDLIKLEKKDKVISKWWVRIPLKKIRGGVWLAIKPHKEIDLNSNICESKIIRKNDKYILHLVTEKEIPLKQDYKNIMSIDLGSKNVATVTNMKTGITKFYDKTIRTIRGKYFHLRKKLGQKKLQKVIEKLGSKEKRIIEDKLHKISREIVEDAKKSNSLIVIGDLRGYRNTKKWNRKSERKKSSMPSHKLKTMIKYKAEQEGIKVIEVNEHYTSKTCNVCGNIGNRRTQGNFNCDCGYEDNADRNGSINIGKRVLWYHYNIGVLVNKPLTEHWKKDFNSLEANQLVGW
jgi:putative transposase